MKPITIYTVEIGEYSDYRVLASFEKREDAEEYAEEYNDDPFRCRSGYRATLGLQDHYPAS